MNYKVFRLREWGRGYILELLGSVYFIKGKRNLKIVIKALDILGFREVGRSLLYV